MRRDPVSDAHRRLAVRTTGLIALTAVPVVGGSWMVLGPAGAVSALIGVGFVLLLFGASAAALAWTVARHPGAAFGVLVMGAFGRLALYAIALSLLSTVTWVHRPALAIATGTVAVVTLVAEMRWMSRMPELFWVDAEAAGATAVAHATRS